jgi:hypothetical protein
MPPRVVVGRVQDRPLEKALHHRHLSPSAVVFAGPDRACGAAKVR